MDRRCLLLGLPLALAGCAAREVWAPDDVIADAVYRGTGPKSLTLYTMRNVGSGSGAHSALMIDASQRVLFDPAGAWEQEQMPERNDVLFGVTPALEQYYVSFHARVTYYVVGQKVVVPADVAERALSLALVAGPVPQAGCTLAVSGLLQQLPGFGAIRRTLFPEKLSEQFGTFDGVETREYRENDADDKSVAAREIAQALKERR